MEKAMNRPLRDVSRFSAKAARRWRLICFAIGFIAIAVLAMGSALILAFNDPEPQSLHAFGITPNGIEALFFDSPVKPECRMPPWHECEMVDRAPPRNTKPLKGI
jgi:hypothetical protein